MSENQWLGIELRHLAALEAVAREGSFRRAATSLGYVQSAISQQIAALERAVGRRLVERTRGGAQIELTEAGRLVLQHSDAILARLKAAQADVEALTAGTAGELRVGITQSVGVRILPALMQRFVGDWPHVRVRPTEAAADLALYAAVERGETDLSFVELPLAPGPFEAVELMSDPFVLVVRRDSPLARGTTSLADLATVPLIGHTECRGLARVEAQLRARGVEPDFAFRSDVNATIQALVGAGLGAAVLPVLAVDESDELTTMRALPDIPPRVLALVRHHSPAAQAFVDAAIAVCTALDDTALKAAQVENPRRLTAVAP